MKTSAQDAYDAAHDPVNAAVLAPAIANARPEKTRSQTYSAYAESLKGSASDRRHWAARCLRTTKMAADAPVAAAAASVPGIAEDTAKQREVFMRTVVGSRLYYGDVLNPEGIAAVEAKLARATPEEAEETLGAFRDVHAGRRRTGNHPPAPPARTSARDTSPRSRISGDAGRLPRTRGVS